MVWYLLAFATVLATFAVIQIRKLIPSGLESDEPNPLSFVEQPPASDLEENTPEDDNE